MMSNSRTTHWTENEELLEQYVLGHLDAAARAALDEHLRHCQPCRENVRHEQVVAAGIRRLGRTSLRDRLAHRLESVTPSPVPWMRILAAAAVIVMIVGVGTYYRWFATQQPHGTTETVSSDAVGPTTGAKEMKEEGQLAERSETSGDGAEGTRNRPRASEEQRASTAQSPSAEVPLAQENYRRDEKKATSQSAEKETTLPDRRAPTVNELDMVGDKQHFAARGAGAGATGEEGKTDVLWIDGVVLGEARAIGESNRELELLSSVRKDEASARPTAAPPGLAGRQKTADRYSVIQKPLSSLPLSQQSRQQYLGAKTVQTEIQRVNGTIQLTLFTDVAADSAAGGQAAVHEAGGDSLIVFIDSHTVVYRLPRGWRDTISRH